MTSLRLDKAMPLSFQTFLFFYLIGLKNKKPGRCRAFSIWSQMWLTENPRLTQNIAILRGVETIW